MIAFLFQKQIIAKKYFQVIICDNNNNFLNLKLNFIFNKFKVVFCVFGPLYFLPIFKRFILISGFARPDIIFDDIYQYKGLTRLKGFITKWIFMITTNYYIVESDLVKKRLIERLNIEKSKIYVVSNSISNEIKKLNIKKEISQDIKVAILLELDSLGDTINIKE